MMIKDTRAFIDECAKNAKNRRKNKKHQENWRKEYCASLRVGKTEYTSMGSLSGSTATKSIFNLEWQKQEDEDTAERNKKAIEEAKEKAKCVAPAYSKGAYQYLGTASDAKDAGKKTSQID